MAYTIGSEAGKKKAQEMKAGESWTNTTDGSKWTKNADGSVSVTHQGVTTNNAYTPTSSSVSGGTSGGTSSSGSSWNSDRYTSTGGDVGDYGKNQMATGVDWREVLKTYYDRQNKASTTDGLGQYSNDALQDEMWDYIVKGMEAENKEVPNNYISTFNGNYNQEKPTYESQYDPAMLELMNKILSREDFSYDAQKDPLYQQYAAMYQQEGDRAMRDTMAEAAASAGGMNSYAITAAQQANNYYASQLSNKIPELYQLAYEMYLQDKESMVQDLGILQGLDDTQYNRYRDTMSDYYADKNFAYGMYQDAVAQGNWEKTFNYNQLIDERDFNYQVGRDTISDNRYANEWDYNVSQQEKAEAETAKEQALQKAVALLELGQMPGSDLLKEADLDEAYASAYLAGIKAQKTSTKSSGGTSASKNYSKVYKELWEYKDDQNEVENLLDMYVGSGDITEAEKKKILDDFYGSQKQTEEDWLVAKAAKEVSLQNLTADSLIGMLNIGWIVYDEEEDKFKRTMDFGASINGLGFNALQNGMFK